MAFQDPFAPQSQTYGQAQATTYDQGLRAYMLRIYNLMASGLALTGIVAMLVATNPNVMSAFYYTQGNHVGMSGLGWIVLFAPLGLLLWLNFAFQNMQPSTAQAIFWAFAALTGVSLAPVLLIYTGSSVARTFFVTAGTFGAMSLIGYTTKRDLTGMGHFLIMGLIGLILASLVSMFFPSPGISFALSVIGVLIFTGLTAYDTQKLKNMYYSVGASGDMAAKFAILGALNLYLDFYNMFIFMLRFMGDRR